MDHLASLWGDSLTAGIYPQVGSAATVAYGIYGGGVSGEISTQIKTRMLAAPGHFSDNVMIWAGRNNYTDPTTVKADTASMVAACTGRYLVVSILNGSSEGVSTNAYNTIMQLNADLSALYGANYYDLRAYLVSKYDAGQPQDVTDHTNDIPPTSLRVDNIHLTTPGYQLAWAQIDRRLLL